MSGDVTRQTEVHNRRSRTRKACANAGQCTVLSHGVLHDLDEFCITRPGISWRPPCDDLRDGVDKSVRADVRTRRRSSGLQDVSPLPDAGAADVRRLTYDVDPPIRPCAPITVDEQRPARVQRPTQPE